jgi:outer membrane protein assembly factor BamB
LGVAATSVQFGSIGAIGAIGIGNGGGLPEVVRLGGTVKAQLVAVDGLIVASLHEGNVRLLSEEGEVLLSLSVGGADERIQVTPALVDGCLYIISGEHLLAYDIAPLLDGHGRITVRTEWETRIAGAVIRSPLVVSGGLIFVVGLDPTQALVKAFACSDGQPAWESMLDVSADSQVHLMVVDNLLVLMTSFGVVRVIQTEKWQLKYETKFEHGLNRNVDPYVFGKDIVFVDEGQNICKFTPGSNQPQPKKLYPIGHSTTTSLATSDEYIAIGHDAGLTLLTASGKVLWSNDTLESISVTPIIAGESIFAVGDEGHGYLFRKSNGNPIGRVSLGGSVGKVQIPPVMTRTRIVIMSANGNFVSCRWEPFDAQSNVR